MNLAERDQELARIRDFAAETMIIARAAIMIAWVAVALAVVALAMIIVIWHD